MYKRQTQGLHRIVELFEGRKPKNSAIITEIGGSVRFDEEKRQRVIEVTNTEESKRYTIPYGFKIKVQEGQEVQSGDSLTEGSINPHDILAVKGEQEVQNYLIAEVQKMCIRDRPLHGPRNHYHRCGWPHRRKFPQTAD